MYTEPPAKLRCKNFPQAAIFLVFISPTGCYTQIKWAGTFVDDFLDPISAESNALVLGNPKLSQQIWWLPKIFFSDIDVLGEPVTRPKFF